MRHTTYHNFSIKTTLIGIRTPAKMHTLIEKVSGQVEWDCQFTYFFKQHMEILRCTREEAPVL
jgi:hypothetical protein